MKKEKYLRSRILEYFSKELLEKIEGLIKDVRLSDNNAKTDILVNILNYYLKDKYIELGPGTNRYAILIDNYVFKIALDKWGIRDNINEFNMSQELQPYVVKTYETNRIISVCEYVTVISKEEFIEKKEEIQKILAILADSYLLGDVGTVNKNYLNWGYRDDGELTILDYAYIYNIKGNEIICSSCQTEILEYDENFYELICPKCHRKYSFIDIRRKISSEQEKKEAEMALNNAYKLTKPYDTISDVQQEINQEISKNINKEEESIIMHDNNNMEQYLKMLELLNKKEDDESGLIFTPAMEKNNKINLETLLDEDNEDEPEEYDDEDNEDEPEEYDYDEDNEVEPEEYDYDEDNEDEPEEYDYDEDNEDEPEEYDDEDYTIEVQKVKESEGELKIINHEDNSEDFEKYYDAVDKIKFNNEGGNKTKWD